MVAMPDPLVGPRPYPGVHSVPNRLAIVLQRAHAAELHAVGDERRPAFALTRALLGGARRAGYSAQRLAECLGVSLGSVRGRSGSDGWICLEAFCAVADLGPDTVNRWRDKGMLPTTTLDHAGQPCYLASELVRACLRDADEVQTGERTVGEVV